jgi:hypothetical protein
MAFSIFLALSSDAFALALAYCRISEGFIPVFSAIAEIFIGRSLKNEAISSLYSNSVKSFISSNQSSLRSSATSL